MRILFLLTNPIESPAERYRVFQYLPYFEARGIHCAVETIFESPDYRYLYQPGFLLRKGTALLSGFLRRLRVLLQADRFDLAVIHRQSVFFWPGLVETFLERAGVPFLVDIDDALFLPSPGAVNRLSFLVRSPKNLPGTLRRAACVVAGNTTIARFAAKHCRRVEVVPTCVDTSYYGFRRRNGTVAGPGAVVIGWMGSHATAAYLDSLDPVFSELTLRHPKTKVRVVGAEYHHPSGLIECRPWRLDTEVDELAGFDIGIMPMDDNEWARGKCGLKLLQYMAAGIPVVASPVGVSAEIVANGKNGFLASTPADWLDKFSLLIGSPSLRESLSREGRRTVEERYSVAAWASRLIEIVTSAAQDR